MIEKVLKSFLATAGITAAILTAVIYAVPSAPPGGFGGGHSGSSASSVTYSGNTTISSDITEDSPSYTSSTGSQNALLVSGGNSTINEISVNKTGDSSGDEADFYGVNAAILTYNGATLNINGGNVTTNGSHANGIFSYGTGVINVNNATISTTSNNSGGVMVTGGGILTANNVVVNTDGNSSAAIRSDRGGGKLTVNGGTYQTNGTGSPAIYSTADIVVNDAKLTSTSSEGVVVEGANSVSLNNVELIDTNTTLNGNSETYKNIFLYQSMSGDADEGNASFTAKDSTITTNKGDTIFVTNTTATINLENNTFVNNDGDFLRIQTGKWGTSGSNGGNVTLNMTNQKIEGNIIVDNISTLNLNMTSGSVLIGSINAENTAKNVSISLSKDSIISLTGNAYLNSLDNEVVDNSNIYLNGYTLYVNGSKISANEGVYEEDTTDNNIENSEVTTDEKNHTIYYVIGAAILVVGVCVATFVILRKKKVNQ